MGISLLHKNNKINIADKDKARILNNQFSRTFFNDDQKTPGSCAPAIDDITITIGGVKKPLRILKVYKANTPNGIPAIILNETSKNIK